MSRVKPIVAAFALMLLCVPTTPARTPVLPVQTLDERSLRVPSDLSTERPSLLVVGFSKASRKQTSSWMRCVTGDEGLKRDIDVYQVVVLEDVPKLFRAMVVSGMRKDVPPASQGRFLLVTSRSAEWKAWTKFAAADDAYVLVLKNGAIGWRSHGPCGPRSLEALRGVVAQGSERQGGRHVLPA